MEDLTLRYFDAEMRYLRDAAKEFMQTNPEAAARLGMMSPGAYDPSVEQVFQGFAFLMGRLREKLDDDIPELTEGLVNMLWSQYLRLIPSLCIVEFSQNVRSQKVCEIVPAKFEVTSRPVGPRNTVCRYRTTRDLTLRPMTITKAGIHYENSGHTFLRLRFECSHLADWSEIDLERIPVYLNADLPLASELHVSLTDCELKTAYIRYSGDTERYPFDGYFALNGFEDSDRLMPNEERPDMQGYRLMFEYFTFREKFMFITLKGLEKVTFPEGMTSFEIEIVFNRQWDPDFSVTHENFRLHCVPVINLFSLDALPLRLNPQDSEYLTTPLHESDGHAEVFSVDRVCSTKRESQQEYLAFSTFQHQGGARHHRFPERYFHTRVRRGPSGRSETWLILGGSSFEEERILPKKSLTVHLTGTNGNLPRMVLSDILLDTLDADASFSKMKVLNLTKPTLPCYPPNIDQYHWKIMSHMGSNFLSMMDDAEVLRNTLSLYNWTDDPMNKRRIEGITKVVHYGIERFEKGFLARGVNVEITIDSSQYAGEGDYRFFGEFLSQFHAQYADIHLFNKITLVVEPEGRRLVWSEKHSKRLG